jgi:metal-dependent amidase/aminoacylase/carboxypeptidase family protein
MTSEDFAYYSQEIPAVFYRFGITKPGSESFFPLHSPNFVIHEEALKDSSALLTFQAVQFLK